MQAAISHSGKGGVPLYRWPHWKVFLRAFYSLLHYLLVPLVILYLVWRGLKSRAYWDSWSERFGYGPNIVTSNEAIWIHAVSVGEVQAAAPLVRALLERHHDRPLVITTTTPTGKARTIQMFGEQVLHCYMPYDLPGAMKRFLRRVRPRVAIILETELWPNLFHYCYRQNVSVILANTRLSARSAAGYARFGTLVSEMLSNVDLVAAQSEVDASRIVNLGAPLSRVHVTGSMKFDVQLPASLREEAQALRRIWGVERNVWIAASTHQGEDEQVLDALTAVLRVSPGCLLVLTPRHPERFSRVTALCRRRGYRTANRSENPQSLSDVDVFIGDSMGELPLLYAASDVAFVGGSLVESGGHNMLEPAALGVPVIVGPHVFNFDEISRRLCDGNAAVQVRNSTELSEQVSRFFTDANLRHAMGQNGKNFVDGNRGACARVIDLVDQLIIPSDF